MRLYCLLLVTLLLSAGCEARPAAGPPAEEASAERTPVEAAAVPAPDSTTRRLFEETMAFARAERLHERPLGEIMQAVGLRFQGMPYVAGMLDEPDEEQLICMLNQFDCVTFVETTLALARGIRAQDYRYETFARHIRDQRYRGGQMDGYCSRLHYFSEWIYDNEARGSVKNITREIGGVPFDKQIDFMSTHRASYPRFAEDDSVYACIRQMEAGLADLELYYIPQDRIREAYDQLQAGDIIATATHLGGLDVTHTGLVYDHGDGTRGLLHASTRGGVKVSPDLQRYVQGVKQQVGIIVARPVAR